MYHEVVNFASDFPSPSCPALLTSWCIMSKGLGLFVAVLALKAQLVHHAALLFLF